MGWDDVFAQGQCRFKPCRAVEGKEHTEVCNTTTKVAGGIAVRSAAQPDWAREVGGFAAGDLCIVALIVDIADTLNHLPL